MWHDLMWLGIFLGATAGIVGVIFLMVQAGRVAWVVFAFGLFGSFARLGDWAEWGAFVVFYYLLAVVLGLAWKGLRWAVRRGTRAKETGQVM